MAREVQNMNITIQCSVSGGVATVQEMTVQGGVGDPAGANEYAIGPQNIQTPEAFDGTKTGNTIVTDCLAALKTAGGVP